MLETPKIILAVFDSTQDMLCVQFVSMNATT